jgi:hypothetical protein
MVPDEAEHFAYVQSLAENGKRPPRGPPDAPLFSTEERTAGALARTGGVLADTAYKPAWEPSAERAWRAAGARGLAPGDIAASGSQTEHTPLYYASEAVPYAAASGGDLFGRLFLMRLWSGLLMLVTTAGAWLLIGELTGKDRVLQLAGAACVGLQPMATFISAGVNPDALLYAAYAIALWIGVRLVRRPPSAGAVAGLIGATVVAILAKPAGLALVPATAFVLALVARDRLRGSRRAALAGAAAGAGLLVAGVAVNRGVSGRAPVDLQPATLRGFGTYLWDFYLPRLPFQHRYPALSIDNPGWTVWVKHAWGSFGLLEVQFPGGVYVVLAAVALGFLVAAGTALAKGRFRPGRATLIVFGLTAACLVAGIHWVDFQAVNGGGGRVIQGRYLLPLMPIVGVAVAAALSNLTRRREAGAAVVLGGMAVLQLFSLAVVAGRYFA